MRGKWHAIHVSVLKLKRWYHTGKRFTSLIMCLTFPCQIDIEVWVNDYTPWVKSWLANIVDQPYHKLVHTLQKRSFFMTKTHFCIWRLTENAHLTRFEQINTILLWWAHNPAIMTFTDADERWGIQTVLYSNPFVSLFVTNSAPHGSDFPWYLYATERNEPNIKLHKN